MKLGRRPWRCTIFKIKWPAKVVEKVMKLSGCGAFWPYRGPEAIMCLVYSQKTAGRFEWLEQSDEG